MNDTEFELSKMAVTDGVQGLIGKKLMEHCIKAAEENHLEKRLLYILTED
jgi:N-acetylglutamate synthase-like GNAT family acetyltransferase